MVARRVSVGVVRAFLVAYDYGTGGLWAVVEAPSADAILAKYPEVVVAETRPEWMTDDRYEQLALEPLRLDEEPPSGMFRAVVADRG